MGKRDELFGALSARLLSFTALYDADAVLAPEAASLARALMASVPDPSRDRAAVLAIAEFYSLRALLLPVRGGDPVSPPGRRCGRR